MVEGNLFRSLGAAEKTDGFKACLVLVKLEEIYRQTGQSGEGRKAEAGQQGRVAQGHRDI